MVARSRVFRVGNAHQGSQPPDLALLFGRERPRRADHLAVLAEHSSCFGAREIGHVVDHVGHELDEVSVAVDDRVIET